MGKQLAVVDEFSEEEYNSQEITSEDYGFILDGNGDLKSVFLPDNVPFRAPKNVNKILKIFGVVDVQRFDSDPGLH
jgi:hypothetical protein